MSGFVQALRARDALAFKEKLRNIDILLIDDMKFLQGPTIQQEFCHTLNSLIDGGRQVVVAADRAPTHLDKLDMRVRSRLGGGLASLLGTVRSDAVRADLGRHPPGVLETPDARDRASKLPRDAGARPALVIVGRLSSRRRHRRGRGRHPRVRRLRLRLRAYITHRVRLRTNHALIQTFRIKSTPSARSFPLEGPPGRRRS